MKEWTYAELFAGIGAPGVAIQRVSKRYGDKAKFVYGFEKDKYARNAFCAIHGIDESKVYHDIMDQPSALPYVDIIFYSPPCTTFSIAGKRAGTEVDMGNLFYAALQVIKKSNPMMAIMENVKNLKEEFSKDFGDMCKALEAEGYISYGQVLNSKDYGVPQHRERIFLVSIRKDLYDAGHRFEFPKPIKLSKCLKDIMEEQVDDKYYLSEKAIKGLMNQMKKKHKPTIMHEQTAYTPTLDCRVGATTHFSPYIIELPCNLYPDKGRPQSGRIYDEHGISPALDTMEGGNRQPKVLRENDVIRKLTPLECFRLQGFDDKHYYRAVAAYDKTWRPGASNSQMYIRAGNSITVQVEEEILENLLYERVQSNVQLSLL